MRRLSGYILLGLAAAAAHGQEAASLAPIVETWRAGQWTEREAATGRALDAWRDWSERDLERLRGLATADGDPEVRLRAARAVRGIEFRRAIGPALVSRAVAGGLEGGGEERWFPVLVEVGRSWGAGVLSDEDVAGLVRLAGYVRWEERHEDLVSAFETLAFRPAASLLAAALGSADRRAADRAARVLVEWRAYEHLAGIVDHLSGKSSLYLNGPFEHRIGPSECGYLHPLLDDERSHVRSWAVWALGRRGARPHRDEIARLLDDAEGVVRAAAIEALGALVATEYAGRIAAHLGDRDSRVRGAAVRALWNLGDPSHASALATLLDDTDPEVRMRAILALAFLGSADAADRLFNLLLDPDPFVARCARASLGPSMGDAREDRLAELLTGESTLIRGRAAEALAAAECLRHAGRIEPLLEDPSGDVRAAAALALGRIGPIDSAPRMGILVEDPHPAVRIAAAKALGELDTRGAPPIPWDRLVAMLSDPLPSVVVAALEVLANPRASGQAAAVEAQLGSPSREVRARAIDCLAAMHRVAAIDRIAEGLEDPEGVVRSSAIRALGELRGVAHAGRIAEALEDRETAIAAATALGQLGGRGAAGALARVAGRGEVILRAYALSALAQLGAREHAALVVESLGHPNPGLRAIAASTLADLGATEFSSALETYLATGFLGGRLEAAESLLRLRGAAGLPAAAVLLEEASPAVRAKAIRMVARAIAAGVDVDDEAEERNPWIVRLGRLAEDPHPDVRRAASGGLFALGAVAEPPANVDPEDLLRRLEPDAFQRLAAQVDLQIPVAGGAELERFLASRGFGFEAPPGLRLSRPLHPGVRTSARAILSDLGMAYLVECDRVRVLSIEDARAVLFARWFTR